MNLCRDDVTTLFQRAEGKSPIRCGCSCPRTSLFSATSRLAFPTRPPRLRLIFFWGHCLPGCTPLWPLLILWQIMGRLEVSRYSFRPTLHHSLTFSNLRDVCAVCSVAERLPTSHDLVISNLSAESKLRKYFAQSFLLLPFPSPHLFAVGWSSTVTEDFVSSLPARCLPSSSGTSSGNVRACIVGLSESSAAAV